MHLRLSHAITLIDPLAQRLFRLPVRAKHNPRLSCSLSWTIIGTSFNLVDQRANYACTDGRWILGDPFTLGDGRQVAM
jgi:hypothetical protein